jgi:acid phosphatase
MGESPVGYQGETSMRRFAGVAAAGVAAIAAAMFAASARPAAHATPLSKIDHFVVVYEENHSFDNLYGGWEGVNGRANAVAANTTQVDQHGNAYPCLPQLDVNIVALTGSCGLANTWFLIDPIIKPTDTTCPPPSLAFGPNSKPNGWLNGTGLSGGCTRDIVHRFYQEQYQLNGGAQNRYMVGSDAEGTVMGVYDTTKLPIYTWLHSKNHPSYVIADNFFQAAFGGSFLNHQYVIAAQAPVDHTPRVPDLHSLLDSKGFPNAGYPLYTPEPGVTYRDSRFTMACPAPLGLACGDYAVNTIQPAFEPASPGDRIVAQTNPTIGDRLTEEGVDWAWYSGGWANANGITTDPGYTNGPGPTCSDPNHDTNAKWVWPNCPDFLFQTHHQPFNYFANYGPGTPGRAHLQDEADFLNLIASSRKQGNDCDLKPVSFWKPIGEENEHPGYASEPNGNSKLVDILQSIESSGCAKNTMVIVTYDEFGGEWDHVAPPKVDKFGPGSRVPALILAPYLKNGFGVDSTEHDTTSILKTIENRYGLDPLATRDRDVSDLSSVWDAKRIDNK